MQALYRHAQGAAPLPGVQCLSQDAADVESVYGPDELALLSRLSGDARMPIARWDGMIELAQREMGDVDVVLRLVEFMGPMDRGALGFITMASRDLHEAAQAFAKFYALLSDAYALDVAMLDDRLTTRMQALTSHRGQTARSG